VRVEPDDQEKAFSTGLSNGVSGDEGVRGIFAVLAGIA
jgi:hypothetical protein